MKSMTRTIFAAATRPAGFTPAMVPGLVAWYGRSGYTAGAWPSRYATGIDAVMATGAKQPAVDSTTYGRACPAHDGVNDELDIPSSVSVDQRNFAAFVRFWSDGPRVTQQAAAVFVLGSTGVGFWVQPGYEFFYNVVGIATKNYVRYGDNVLSLRSSASRVKFTNNGTAYTGSAVASSTITGGKLGWYAADALAGPHRYAEFILYNADVSDADATSILSYMSTGTPTAPASYAYPLLICDGNSMTYGAGSTGVTHTYPSVLKAALTNPVVCGNFGVSGQQTSDMTLDSVAQIDPLYSGSARSKNVVIAWEGTNSIYFGASAATTFAALKTYCAARKSAGWSVLLLTITDRSDAGTPGTFTASRNTVNASLRADFPTATAQTRVFSPGAGITYADYLVDIAANATIGADGAQTNTTYYADLVHMTDAGYVLVSADVKNALSLLGVT